jgi:hypothetical protein
LLLPVVKMFIYLRASLEVAYVSKLGHNLYGRGGKETSSETCGIESSGKSLVFQLVRDRVVSKKRRFLTGFTRVFSNRVEPHLNDKGCHRLLLTRDSPTCPGSEYVNMWNRIDREVCSKSNLNRFTLGETPQITRVCSDRVEPHSNDSGCHRLLLTGDSPTSPRSEYVNMWNRIDRESLLKSNLNRPTLGKTQFIYNKPKMCPAENFLTVADIGVLAATKDFESQFHQFCRRIQNLRN